MWDSSMSNSSLLACKPRRLDGDQDGGWVSVSSGTGSPGQSWTKGRKTVVVVVR